MSQLPADDVSALTFEAALAELDTLIEKLEAGSVALDDAIGAYERGTRLARHCETLLDRTERRVSALVVNGDGSIGEAPLSIGGESRASPASPPGEATEALPRAHRTLIDPDDVPF